jgi:hypothetical protein
VIRNRHNARGLIYHEAAVSIPVSLDALRGGLADFGPEAYVLTVGEDGRAHAVLVSVGWEGDLLVTGVGKTTARNAGRQPQVSLLWPRQEPGGYSLIVDGSAEVDDGRLRLAPSRAVLHRAAPAGAATAPEGACGSDCVPLLRS